MSSIDRPTPPPDTPDPWRQLESTWREAESTVSNRRAVHRIMRLGRRQHGLHRAVVIGEVLICLIFGILALGWLWSGTTADRVVAIFVLTTVGIVAVLRRRAWLDHGANPNASPLSYIEQLLAQNADGYRAIAFGQRLLFIEVLFFALWLPWSRLPPGSRYPSSLSSLATELVGVYSFLLIWTAGFLTSLWASRRYLDRERRQLEQIQAELAEDDSGSESSPEMDSRVAR